MSETTKFYLPEPAVRSRETKNRRCQPFQRHAGRHRCGDQCCENPPLKQCRPEPRNVLRNSCEMIAERPVLGRIPHRCTRPLSSCPIDANQSRTCSTGVPEGIVTPLKHMAFSFMHISNQRKKKNPVRDVLINLITSSQDHDGHNLPVSPFKVPFNSRKSQQNGFA